MILFNLHTHHRDSDPTNIAIHNVYPDQLSGCKELPAPFSCGVHPWFINQDYLSQQIEQMSHLIRLPECVAIGECGLDKLCSVPMELQEIVFRKMINLSEQAQKPMIIHCVKAYDRLLDIRQKTKPIQPWIIHGFRGNPVLAAQLIKKGLFLSFGKLFNSETVRSIPTEYLFLETDDQSFPIYLLYQQVAELRNTSVEQLSEEINQLAKVIFSPNLFNNMFKK
ncbi:MAG: TatD family hydrolase [Bacteroidales bacterium]